MFSLSNKRKLQELHEKIIDQAKKGDSKALNKLYSMYSKAMLNTSYRIVNNLQDAEDVLHDSFMKAFAKMNQYSGKATFGAWLKRIVVNNSIDFIKKKQKNGFHFEINETTQSNSICNVYLSDNEKVDNQEQLKLVYEAIQLLPTGYRTIFSLYLLEGYDHEEIAEILKISVSTSISQLCRAKKKLIILTQKKS